MFRPRRLSLWKPFGGSGTVVRGIDSERGQVSAIYGGVDLVSR